MGIITELRRRWQVSNIWYLREEIKRARQNHRLRCPLCRGYYTIWSGKKIREQMQCDQCRRKGLVSNDPRHKKKVIQMMSSHAEEVARFGGLPAYTPAPKCSCDSDSPYGSGLYGDGMF